MKIVFADDMIYNRLLIAAIFKSMKVEYVEFDNGQKVVDYLKENTCDAIFLDIEMPVMNGFETAIEIKQEMKLKTPIIAFTAHHTEEVEKKMKQIGFDYILYKPFEISNVKRILDEICK